MAVNIQLKDFTSKTTLVPADLVYSANSADSFNEVQTTVEGLIGAYAALLSIAELTTVENQYILTTGSNTYSAVTVTAIPTASVLAAWDENKNFSATNLISGFTTQATAAGTTVLTVDSNAIQEFTGSTTQTVTLPVVSTLVAGQGFTIINSSSGVVTVNSSGGNVVQAMAAGTTLRLTCVLITGTTAASWSKSYQISTFPLSVVNGGTGVSSVTTTPTASAWAGWDANSNFSANALIPGFATTVTAAGNTVLTVSSKEIQEFTGSTTQTVTLPVASTLVAGQQFTIINNSSGNVTVQSSGGNTIQVMAANTTLYLDLVLASGTTAASWNSGYVFDNGAGVLSITGTANEIIASSSTGAVTLSLPAKIANCISQVSVQVFTSSGTYTPTVGMKYCIVECIGGGGGSAGCSAGGGQQGVGGAGGGGGYSAGVYSASTIGVSQSVTIGVAGTAGTAGNNGGGGGTSSFGALLTCTGGSGGTAVNNNASSGSADGGAGGTGSGGLVNISGQKGGRAYIPSVTNCAPVPSGLGGDSPKGFGLGGSTTSSSGGAVSGNGLSGSGYGSGGGSSMCGPTTSAIGAAGTPGYILVTEFI